jgi:YafQ family addiction module toxin component
MYRVEIKKKARKKLRKLKKKNPKSYEIVDKKIEEITINPNRYKNLTGNLKRYKRVHVGNSSYVLCFRIDEINKIVVFVWFGHHDDSY